MRYVPGSFLLNDPLRGAKAMLLAHLRVGAAALLEVLLAYVRVELLGLMAVVAGDVRACVRAVRPVDEDPGALFRVALDAPRAR